jgi:hypothetical protein
MKRVDATMCGGTCDRTVCLYRFAKRLNALEAAKASELEQLHARVKATVSKKDAIIQSLQTQLQSKDARIQAIEKLLHQQKKALLDA